MFFGQESAQMTMLAEYIPDNLYAYLWLVGAILKTWLFTCLFQVKTYKQLGTVTTKRCRDVLDSSKWDLIPYIWILSDFKIY